MVASDLSTLAQDSEEEIAEPIRVRHPSDPRYVLIFRSNSNIAEAQSCEKRTARSKSPIRDQNALFLAITNIGIEREGTLALNLAGKVATFRDPELLEQMKVKTALDCVVKFLRHKDGHIVAMAEKVMRDSGFGAEVEDAGDPYLTRVGSCDATPSATPAHRRRRSPFGRLRRRRRLTPPAAILFSRGTSTISGPPRVDILLPTNWHM